MIYQPIKLPKNLAYFKGIILFFPRGTHSRAYISNTFCKTIIIFCVSKRYIFFLLYLFTFIPAPPLPLSPYPLYPQTFPPSLSPLAFPIPSPSPTPFSLPFKLPLPHYRDISPLSFNFTLTPSPLTSPLPH